MGCEAASPLGGGSEGGEPGAHCHFGGGKTPMEGLVLSTQTTG